MTVYVGGLRERLVQDSMYYKINNGLSALGWFNPNPTGYTHPVNLIPEQVPWSEEIPLNSVTVSMDHVVGEEWEVGIDTYRNEYVFYIDVYGENDALGRQISGDIRDLLRGKFPNLGTGRGGYSQPTLDVYDYSHATPSWIFFCDLEDVIRDRMHNFPHRWQRYLYTVRVTAIDYYGDQNDSYAYGSEP